MKLQERFQEEKMEETVTLRILVEVQKFTFQCLLKVLTLVQVICTSHKAMVKFRFVGRLR